MSNKPSSPTQLARAEKQKIAHTEGAKAIADHQASGVAVRKNMERLRALRLAKEAEDAAREPELKTAVKKKAAAKGTKAAPKTKAGAKTKAPPLSEWLASQKDTGRAS
jgi:hypothetical protein